MVKELSKTYEPHAVEDRWIDFWLEKNIFAANPSGSKKKSYSIVIPPPNVTGSLHMGHALNSTLQDILIRTHRMKDDNTLWVVGTDHAGIATQNVVERQLKEEKKSRFDLGREKFIERVWKWKDESGGTIINQLKRLGASCDYKNERFTMDEGLSAAVAKVFVSLYDEGLIYRGLRLIHWCPRCHTALSDLEVEHENQKGKLWHIKYPFVDKPQEGLFVATTRPETLFGDAAVAVNPDDERYKNDVGRKVQLPLTEKQIPIIADSFVAQDFGSGVVKITPAHDFNDYAAGVRHGLPKINIFDESAHLNENVPEKYRGLDRFKARETALKDLEEAGLLAQTEDYQNAVGHCYRCKTIVEPYLSNQWYVKTKPLAEKAMAAVKEGKTKFVPQHWEKTYFQWMENIQDWCISRQIWWGHQIPAWYCVGDKQCQMECKEPIVSETPPKKCPHCGSKNLRRDEDVLDTWFSSALWPFSTLGWPGEGGGTPPLLKMFYPTSVLVTAFDIIFFWVARMMMMGIHFMGEVPFRHVHIHALVRDPLGQKMSKSKGNVVDPLLMMKKYGTDAFRFTLASFAAQGRDIKLDEARIEGYRNFCNKIWNASRFVLMSAAPFIKSGSDFAEAAPKNRINQWILVELNSAIEKTSRSIENYEFNLAAHAVYNFFWDKFCSWYLELTKEIYRESAHEEKVETARTTYHVLDISLRLLHPFMPFITEEIWQILAERKGRSIALASYPAKFDVSSYSHSWKEIGLAIEAISAIRSIRMETGVPLTEAITVLIQTSSQEQELYREIQTMIFKLAKVKDLKFISDEPREPCALFKTTTSLIAIPLQGLIDVSKEKERQKKKLEKTGKDIELLKQKLESPEFIQNAPPELIAEKKAQLKEAETQSGLINKALQLL